MGADSSSYGAVAPKHFVRLYDDDRALTDFVVQFVESGLGAGGAAILVATPSHMSVVVSELERAGTDLKHALATRRLTLLDARTTLDALMLDGMPDPKRFRAVVMDALKPAFDAGSSVRAFGEMVDLLWQEGNPHAALELERLWNQLAVEHEFALLCGYREPPVKQPSSASLADVCRLHSHVVKSDGEVAMGDPSAEHDAVLQHLRARVQVLGWRADAPGNRKNRDRTTASPSTRAKLDWAAVARILSERTTAKLFVIDRQGFVRAWSSALASALGIERADIEDRLFAEVCSGSELRPIVRSTLARAWLAPLCDCALQVAGGAGRPFVLTVSSEVVGRRNQQALLVTVGAVRPLKRE